MDRRKFLATAAGTLAASSLPLYALGKERRSAFRSDLIVSDPAVLEALKAVRKTSFDCISVGVACLQHCEEQIFGGNAEMFKHCAISVHQMLPICEAVGTLAGHKAVRTRELLDACINACKECEEACKEHSSHFSMGHHQECQACMEACRRCLEACTKLRDLM
ncbi:MAG: Csp1 family four helix bundle copper storage protein [Bdellovibrionota bacterium]